MRPGNATPMNCDVLVLGAGIAGLCVALGANRRRVLVLCPDEPVRSSSSALAQGGIAAAIGATDSVGAHILDTLEAACHSADPAAVTRVIGNAAGAIQYLVDSGVDFDRSDGDWSLHREAGHRAARVLHAAGDRTGEAIVLALWERARAAGHIEFLKSARAVELLQDGGGVCGARVMAASGACHIRARDTVLATGGIGQLFRMTTNGRHATGDGLAMALGAGVRTEALEFVQFHPTALRVEEDPLPLLTEALRGAGATLVTRQGRRIMSGRHPLEDLAPRDIVARAVWQAQQQGEEVLLDATAIFSSSRAQSFPGALDTARRHGFDPARDPLPVTAAAHYHMGGVEVDERGASSLPGLWASGEVACTGLHGANRLASNSLLEAVVYGRATGEALNRSDTSVSARGESLAGLPMSGPEPDPEADPRWANLRDLMWRCMGPERDGTTLQAGLDSLATAIGTCVATDGILRRRLELARAMMQSALARRESRGAHWRRDFPERDATLDVREALIR